MHCYCPVLVHFLLVSCSSSSADDVERAARNAAAEEPGVDGAACVRVERGTDGRGRARRTRDATLSTVCYASLHFVRPALHVLVLYNQPFSRK